MITFEKIKYKNILSSGNQFIELNLDTHKTNLIRGYNGNGKSLVITALIFTLYGKSNRGTLKRQLVNNVNKKDCVVEIDFTIQDRTYKIRRGISPNIFEIYINGKLQDELSAVRDQQKYLEQNILKMSYKTFMQVVVLGSTNYIPFMELSSAERRDLVEELLDIKIFSSMNIVLKDKIRTLESHIREFEIEKTSIENLIKTQEAHIETIRNSGKDIIYQKEVDIKEFLDENQKLIKINEKLQDRIRDLTSELDALLFNPKKLKQYLNLYGKLQQKLVSLTDEVNFFENHSECPTCKQTVDIEFKTTRKNDLSTSIEEISLGQIEISNEIKEEEARERRFKELSNEISKINSNILSNQNEISLKTRQVQKYQKEILDIETKINNQEENLNNLNNLIKKLKKVKRIITQSNKVLDNFKFSSLLLKDTGIKSKIIENYIPIMNSQINKYLQLMDLYINFTLDSEFKETINTPVYENYSYGSFSEGEKQRINLSLLLAWRDVARIKNSVNCNIIFFDETLDSSLDTSGIEDMLKIVNHVVKNSNVFIISHRDIYDDKFERVIEVKKINGFTKMFT